MNPPTVINIRPAGKDHQVLTVQGGSGAYRRQPCDTCPWRVDAVGEFPAEAFRHSANTAYDMATHVFSCHSSGAQHPAICAGFLLRGAYHNMAIRLKMMRRELDPSQVTDGGVELFEDYRSMAEANGVDEDDPVLGPCR